MKLSLDQEHISNIGPWHFLRDGLRRLKGRRSMRRHFLRTNLRSYDDRTKMIAITQMSTHWERSSLQSRVDSRCARIPGLIDAPQRCISMWMSVNWIALYVFTGTIVGPPASAC